MRLEDVELVDWCGYKVRAVRIPYDGVPRGSVFHITTDGEQWDEIAWRYYQDEELFYVICDVNGIADPFEPVEGGRRIVIPPPPAYA